MEVATGWRARVSMEARRLQPRTWPPHAETAGRSVGARRIRRLRLPCSGLRSERVSFEMPPLRSRLGGAPPGRFFKPRSRLRLPADHAIAHRFADARDSARTE